MIRLVLFLILIQTKVIAQVFIPHTYWSCNSTDYDSKTINKSTDFTLGTFSNTNISGDSVVLTVGNTTGTYTSPVLDIFGGCSPLATWRKLDWTTSIPFGKEIPISDETAPDYSGINTGLTTSLVELFHFNGTGAIASSTTITASVGGNGTAANTNGSGLTYTSTGKLLSAITLDGTDDYVSVSYTQTAVSDYTISTWMRSSSAGNNPIVQNRGSGVGQSLTLSMGANPNGCGAGQIAYGLDTDSVYIGKCTNTAYNNGNWHHVLAIWDGVSGTPVDSSQFSIYVDGDSVSTTDISVGTAPNAPLTGLNRTLIGRHDSWTANYNGSLDELGIWTRAFSASDALQMFQRGGNRIKFQIRTCTTSNCGDVASYKGPDNTSATYFSELNNNTNQPSGTGTVLTTSPSMVFANFPSLTVATNRYFQYQATFETDNSTIQPDLKTTSIYHGCAPGSRTFSSDGTFVLPRLCTQMTVTLKGAGGASGRRTGGGTKRVGGAGGMAIKTFTNLTPLTQYSFVIGTGGTCANAATTGAYLGGTGGAGAVGNPGIGAAIGGAGGTGGSHDGGLGRYGGGGGGAGGGPNDGGGGGAASSFSYLGTEWMVAGGGGGSGGSQSSTPGVGGGACGGAVSGDNTLGGAGGNGSGQSGSGGGGGGCYCLGGCAAASAGGGAGGDTTGTGCTSPDNDGKKGEVTISYQ